MEGIELIIVLLCYKVGNASVSKQNSVLELGKDVQSMYEV